MGCGGSKDTAAVNAPAAPAEDPAKKQKEEEERKRLEEEKKRKEALEKEKLEHERRQKEIEQEKAEEERKHQEVLAEAARKEEEANKAAAEAIANQIAGDLAQQKIEQAKEAEAAAKEAQGEQVMESFKGMGAKMRFREALARGNKEVAEDAAAVMLQGAWRSKMARRKVAAKKAEKQRLMEEGCARKLQCCYRSRLARKKVAAKRAEKKALLEAEEVRRAEALRKIAEEEARLAEEVRLRLLKEEEERIRLLAEEEERRHKEALAEAARVEEEANKAAAEAIANQIAADLAQQKIEQARAAEEAARQAQEAQVMESFKGMGAKLRFRQAIAHGKMDVAKDAAAVMLQGAWRSKVARRKVAAKKAEKRKLMEEGCARKLQCCYRTRLARKKVAAKRAEKKAMLEAETKLHAENVAKIEETRDLTKGPETEPVKSVAKKEPTIPTMKTGFIKKCGQVVKNWKSRYFVLLSTDNSSKLTYYVKAKNIAPFGDDEKGFINMKGVDIQRSGNSIILTTPAPESRELKLEFDNTNDKEAWISAFRAHIAYAAKLK